MILGQLYHESSNDEFSHRRNVIHPHPKAVCSRAACVESKGSKVPERRRVRAVRVRPPRLEPLVAPVCLWEVHEPEGLHLVHLPNLQHGHAALGQTSQNRTKQPVVSLARGVP
eukprot:CAMPEP_0114263906 /NCGR_PEP_ID=MMETSP0058-20121206/22845_1 /TAXON_ID=36894 /ORGANISM="Pyramimonas parkeae, CCMP726" /LENGTH=112 /DNA_ID=CAMNT_0001380389 /DNA_START=323 /DNA_END=661 /DNA_ORIENTATION=-